jgi:two-component system sensor histidine kinase/response regulator
MVLNPIATLLIVDDESTQLTALCNTLGQEGYVTVGAASASAALARLREQTFDVLLTDLKMPGTDGIGLLREALAIDPHLVGVMMTGEGTIGTAVEAMQAGALDYILKPFRLSAIMPVLSRAVEVRHLRLENARLTERVRERTAELEAANRELDAFSYSVSHDLRAPMRVVRGFATLLAQDHRAALSADGRHLVDSIIAASQRGERLIQDLLRFSSLNRQPLARREVDVAALVHTAWNEVYGREAGRPVDFLVGPLPPAFADPGLLQQVIVNLVSNALKFTATRARARIEVGSESRAGEPVYFVRDNGVGFDMQYGARLFGAFQRLHADEFPGSGIGLSLVQRIIHRHGGSVWAHAEVDAGATFYFTLGPPPAAASSTADPHE